MRSIILLFLACFSIQAYSQDYDVISYSHVTSETGGFDVVLDSEDWFGYAVEDIGDLNSDGINDIAVGVIKDDDGGFNRGAVYIFFMNNDGTVESYQKISDTEGNFEGFLEDWDILGTSLAYLGDIDDDGLVELAIGAEYDGDGGYRKGAVYIVSLNTDGTVEDHVKISDTQGNFNTDLDVWDVFGSDIALLGDLNGDGNQDIAVGARRDGDGGNERGAVYILFLNADLTVNDYQKISDTEGGFDAPLSFQDYFGASIANIGDLNGDGVIDLAVGAYRDNDGGLEKGAVYILYMNSDGTVADYSKISATSGNLNIDLPDFTRMGRSIDTASDLYQDGHLDLLISAYGYEMEGNQYGAFIIANIDSTGSVVSTELYTKDSNFFTGDLQHGDAFGFSVAYNGNLDGVPSIVSGAFLDDVNVSEAGSLYVLKLGKFLSVDDIENPGKITVYPNPADFSFQLSSYDDVQAVMIYDNLGRIVATYATPLPETFDVSTYASGTYLVRILRNGNESAVAKLLIK